MRAVICRDWCEPDGLEVADLLSPPLTDGGVRIRVRAAGVNFADTLLLAGKYQVKPPFPFSPGLEIAGEVLECAPGVTWVKPGDRVMAILDYGGYAEEVVALETDVFAIPDTMDFAAAAAFPIAYGTSHIGLKDKLGLTRGETLLVTGAAGGVGLTAVEIGKKLGAVVIATAGGADKLAVAKEFGADHLIDYREEDIRERAKELTDGRGVDAVYDAVGGSTFEAALRAAAPLARMLIVGFAAGDVQQIPANILLVKNVTAIGYYWGAHRTLAPDLIAASFDELLAWYADGALKPHVSMTFPMTEAAAALNALKSRKSTGKVVIEID